MANDGGRRIDLVVVHGAATPPSMDIGADTIGRWHVDERSWRSIGYHYVIRRSGELELGRPLEQPGAHVRGHNQNSIGICLVGGQNENNNPDCNYTMNQYRVLEQLLFDLQGRYPDAAIKGHRDLDTGKACPCFDVEAFFDGKT